MAFGESSCHGKGFNFMILLVAVSFALVLSSYKVEGGRNLSKEEDLELERQLKILNKPAIKSIWTEHGDIFDCVDINKQPAFDHPLLKNHKVQMIPKSFPKETVKDGGSSVHKSMQIGLKDGGCPTGTVPIRRIRKEDLIREKFLTNTKKAYPFNIDPLGPANPDGLHNAYLKAPADIYFGTTLLINTWSVNVSEGQSSLVGTWIENQQDSIQTGWMAQPQLFGDSNTRLFTFWTNDNYKTGCFNTYCPGFVQVSQRIPLGMVLPVSTYGGTQAEIEIYVAKDIRNGVWGLTWGPEHEVVGYWPPQLFHSLSMNSSMIIAWGGQGYNPPGTPWPMMGNGHSGKEDYGKACYIRNVKLLKYLGFVTPDPDTITRYGDNCYPLYINATRPEWQFFVGGPTC
ncbi:protein neprosin-like [Tasmannia lanceolata]|uniref:protein neprosin-like n=1 Tax=Tasmannia lanceolata TaxID=3420 RepID=UPI004064928D